MVPARLLTDAIRFHHNPVDGGDHGALTTIVYLADLLMSRFHTGLELERMGTDNLTDLLAQVDLSTEQFGGLVDLIPGKVFEPAMEKTEDNQNPTPD